jgi:hypothetical protein
MFSYLLVLIINDFMVYSDFHMIKFSKFHLVIEIIFIEVELIVSLLTKVNVLRFI